MTAVSCCCCCCDILQYFPFIPAPEGQNQGFSECARKYLAYKPKKGDGESAKPLR
jgi:hypothetical protein